MRPLTYDHDLIHVTVPGSPDDPRDFTAPDGVVVHHAAPLHPDDMDVVDGLPVTSISRTLVDLAEIMDRDELRATFETARGKGLLDMAAVHASRARLEWRPSLPMLDDVIAEFAAD